MGSAHVGWAVWSVAAQFLRSDRPRCRSGMTGSGLHGVVGKVRHDAMALPIGRRRNGGPIAADDTAPDRADMIVLSDDEWLPKFRPLAR